MQVNLHERSSKENILLNILVIIDGQIIKSKTLFRSTFCERDMLCNCVNHKPEAFSNCFSEIVSEVKP